MSSVVKASGSKLSQRRKSDIKWGYFFIFPQLFGVLAFVLFPLVYVLVLSLLEWDGLGAATFVGLTNYTTELSSSEFRNALSNTVYYTVMVVPTSVVLSLMAALALNKLRLKNFFRVIYFAPVVTSAVAAGVVWLWVYNPDFGLINYLPADLVRHQGTAVATRPQVGHAFYRHHEHLAVVWGST